MMKCSPDGLGARCSEECCSSRRLARSLSSWRLEEHLQGIHLEAHVISERDLVFGFSTRLYFVISRFTFRNH